MKRLLLFTLLLGVAVQLQARDIIISSWTELSDKMLTKSDRIVMVSAPDHENDFQFGPRESNGKLKKTKREIIVCSDVVDTSDKRRCSYQGPAKEQSKNNEPHEDLPSDWCVVSESAEKHEEAIAKGTIYCIEEDSFWKAQNKSPECRRIVVVLESEKDNYWRNVLVIAPRIINDGYKWAGKNFVYEETPEHRFSSPLKMAALLGSLGAGLFAWYACS